MGTFGEGQCGLKPQTDHLGLSCLEHLSDVQLFILIFLFHLSKEKANKLADISYRERNYRVSRHQNRDVCSIFLQDCYFSRWNSAWDFQCQSAGETSLYFVFHIIKGIKEKGCVTPSCLSTSERNSRVGCYISWGEECCEGEISENGSNLGKSLFVYPVSVHGANQTFPIRTVARVRQAILLSHRYLQGRFINQPSLRQAPAGNADSIAPWAAAATEGLQHRTLPLSALLHVLKVNHSHPRSGSELLNKGTFNVSPGQSHEPLQPIWKAVIIKTKQKPSEFLIKDTYWNNFNPWVA